MKISELLNAVQRAGTLREARSTKPAAPSQLPVAPRASSIDDVQDGGDEREDDDGEDDGGDLDKLKQVAGDIGGDLYSITVYNTADDFASIKQITKPTWTLEDFSSPAIDSYLAQSDHDISNDKAISCVIYNSRNGEFFRFDSSESGSGFEPALSQLVSSGTVDRDQVGILRDIESIGKKYHHALSTIDWRAGETATGRGASAMYNTLDRLKDALNLREFVERIHDVHISDEQRKKNAAVSGEIFAGAKERIAALKAARDKKLQGPGREKR